MPPTAKSDSSRVTLGPKADIHFYNTHPLVLTDEFIEGLPRLNGKLHVWGRIEYDDIFQKHHITDFCMVQKMGTDKFDACGSNNTAN
jgi:hypothetical protein